MAPEIDLGRFDFALPADRIAQHPLPERDASRLLVLDRDTSARHHAAVRDLPEWLRPGDLLVVNTTRVLPARLRGRKPTGGAVEALLLGRSETEPDVHRALVKGVGRLRAGTKLVFVRGDVALDGELGERFEDGSVGIAFAPGVDPYAVGETPLPPYIRRPESESADAERYQTTFAREPGSVAAPTAGLHLSERLLARLAEAGVGRADVVLHVGIGTFRPLRPEDLARGRLHAERFELPRATAEHIRATRAAGGRVVAVGTTSARVLESCVDDAGDVTPRRGETELFLAPGDRFRAVDALLTNFHLPRSSLLLLVAAFAGRERVLDAYADAIRSGYRFYSYGDAMLIR